MSEKSFGSRDIPWMVVLASFVLFLFSAGLAAGESDFSGWKRYRKLRIPLEYPDGRAAIALESSVLEKCRPDLADLRIVASDGSSAKYTILEAQGDEELNPFPVRVFRMARNPGKWTDIWIDKSAKTLTKGVLLQTSSRDFVRKVEIRGSDNVKEEYVIDVDGLVMDRANPIPINSLKLVHPVNNFQYIHLRIIDDDLPPLKIEGVLCYPPPPANHLSRPLDFKIVEKRTDASVNATTMVLDLGEKRYPLGGLTIATPVRDFSAKLVLSGASLPSPPEVWKKFHEGTVFRIQREEATKQDLTAIVRSQLFRYIKLELISSSQPGPVDKIDLTATMRIIVFNYTRGLSYRLYYDNPSAMAVEHDDKLLSVNPASIANASLETSVEEEQKNIPRPEPAKINHMEPIQPTNWIKPLGVALLLLGLLLLFGIMLRARSLRKAQRRRSSRVVYTRYE
ncbi:MAG: hypothetical protein HY912_15940 [Desulfomonile tiedjei]|uniref:DUF3999 family protein n=1 Tax=Desulfomonile tiedjei TaxID=2358 RepID=A0A9D6Z4I7_9BACT|nr:hypothetical protein [Desulfomonile tiedjei]